jgi:TolA-binding protein
MKLALKPVVRTATQFAFAVSLALGLTGSLTGCLQTRTAAKEQEEKQVLRKQVANLAQTTADVNTRFQEVQDDIRGLNGRVESVENRFGRVDQRFEKSDAAVDARLKDMESKLGAYREEIEALKSQVATMHEEAARRSAQAAEAEANAAKSPYDSAEENFEKKNWREAILDYEKYRRANPKGKNFATATFKIGVAFQEMGLIDDARAFYEEVVQKFPKSKEAGKAASKLKSLTKK